MRYDRRNCSANRFIRKVKISFESSLILTGEKLLGKLLEAELWIIGVDVERTGLCSVREIAGQVQLMLIGPIHIRNVEARGLLPRKDVFNAGRHKQNRNRTGRDERLPFFRIFFDP